MYRTYVWRCYDHCYCSASNARMDKYCETTVLIVRKWLCCEYLSMGSKTEIYLSIYVTAFFSTDGCDVTDLRSVENHYFYRHKLFYYSKIEQNSDKCWTTIKQICSTVQYISTRFTTHRLRRLVFMVLSERGKVLMIHRKTTNILP
jgi:hypothetical protein